ncbi:D-glycero-alpha-D-manno-heptose-1,7-bisphosphate 7-phosphatase [Sphingobium nicotianae]|uniref:D,D-heptose 1,7-bisphosphate phosphatase n=1 Tax=Sphingobium nicotianae TaxID=2782607 RepID=A0A9X1DCC8_9SPHN|nr:HAD family hydrolase [Sphingobium nicotianae]MBT2187510.1 HAD family hydrolase [Sphingobium nicotianae]
MTQRAVFFDRDGVLNVDHGYVGTIERFDWRDGAVAAIRAVNDAGYLAIVVTNQSGVGRGKYTIDDVDALHSWMNEYLALHGARIDAFYTCPFHPDAIVERYRACDHPDRKPNPGMLLRAIAEFDIDRDRSFLVGDSSRDVAAASGAGIKGYLLDDGNLADMVRDLINRSLTGSSNSP